MRVSTAAHGFKVEIALSDQKKFQIDSIPLKPAGSGFACRYIASMCPMVEKDDVPPTNS